MTMTSVGDGSQLHLIVNLGPAARSGVTMPAGDITHPVPDLTGYITEGQLVLAADVFARGVYPPIDPLSSLSRMMRRGVGPGRTRGDHRDVAAQLDASVAQARQVRDLAELVGPDALTATDRRYLAFLDAFERHLVTQRRDESVGIDEAFARVWRVLSVLPRRELTMVPAAVLDASYHPAPRDADPDADPELDPDPDEG